MLANQSIRYGTRMNICEAGQPVTAGDLASFLDRLLMDPDNRERRVIGLDVPALLNRNRVFILLSDLRDLLDLSVGISREAFIVGPNQYRITHYTLTCNEHRLILD